MSKLANHKRVHASQAAANGHTLFERPLEGDAELWLFEIDDDARALGAFQRARDCETSLVRRISGGPDAYVGPGTLWMQLALVSPSALVACDPSKILNRYVRPLLRGLTKAGATAHYFGREWISVNHRPAAQISFAHDSQRGRTVVEAIVGLHRTYADAPRESFMGKSPGSLEAIAERRFDVSRVIDSVSRAYSDSYERLTVPKEAIVDESACEVKTEPPWAATIEEAIGVLGAGLDSNEYFRVGGDWMISGDALRSLETKINSFLNVHGALSGDDSNQHELAALIDQTLQKQGVALEGVRSLKSILAVVNDAIIRKGF